MGGGRGRILDSALGQLMALRVAVDINSWQSAKLNLWAWEGITQGEEAESTSRIEADESEGSVTAEAEAPRLDRRDREMKGRAEKGVQDGQGIRTVWGMQYHSCTIQSRQLVSSHSNST